MTFLTYKILFQIIPFLLVLFIIYKAEKKYFKNLSIVIILIVALLAYNIILNYLLSV